MIIALTGTPGTGKTSVAEQMEGYRVIDLTEFVKNSDIGERGEKEFEADIDSMVEALDEEIEESEDVVIEGHLSHHFPSDYCVVLRCNPEVLEERLSERDYSDQKVSENVEAEKLDIVLAEAVENQDSILEVDTTGRKAEETAKLIEKKIENSETGYGEISWL